MATGGVLLSVPRRVGYPPRADHAEPLLDGRDREASVPVRKETCCLFYKRCIYIYGPGVLVRAYPGILYVPGRQEKPGTTDTENQIPSNTATTTVLQLLPWYLISMYPAFGKKKLSKFGY